MGFSGGGSNILKPHTHDSTIVQDGGSLAANKTQFGLNDLSLLVSDGANIQQLSAGAALTSIRVNAAANAWESYSAQALSPSGSLILSAGALIFPARTNVTLSGGVATLINNCQGIDTEGGAATDDCDTATPVSLTNAAPYWLCSVISSRDVTMKDNSTDLFLAGDFTFNFSTDQMELVARDGNNNLFEVSRSDNN